MLSVTLGLSKTTEISSHYPGTVRIDDLAIIVILDADKARELARELVDAAEEKERKVAHNLFIQAHEESTTEA